MFLTISCLLLCTMVGALTMVEASPGDDHSQRLVVVIDLRASYPKAMRPWVKAQPYLLSNNIAYLEVGAQITIVGCGDTADIREADDTVVIRQPPAGQPSGAYGNTIRTWASQRIQRLADRIQAKPDKRAGIAACIREAVTLLNPQAVVRNRLIVLSDGIDYGRRVPQGTPGFTIPPTTEIIMEGTGGGFAKSTAGQLQTIWRAFFERAGARREYLNVSVPYLTLW